VDPTLPYDAQHTTTNKEPKTILDRMTVKKRKGISVTSFGEVEASTSKYIGVLL